MAEPGTKYPPELYVRFRQTPSSGDDDTLPLGRERQRAPSCCPQGAAALDSKNGSPTTDACEPEGERHLAARRMVNPQRKGRERQLAPRCCPQRAAALDSRNGSPAALARGAVFLDRDGVINNDGYYVNAPEDFELLPGAAAAIRKLNDAGIPVIVITNQGGVALEYIGARDLDAIHDRMDELLALEGAHVDAVYAALAHPDGKSKELCKVSEYRKPAAGMLYQAADDFGIDLARSVMVGDTTTDVAAGLNAGCKALLVKTGFGGSDGRSPAKPDAIVKDLAAAVDWILDKPNA